MRGKLGSLSHTSSRLQIVKQMEDIVSLESADLVCDEFSEKESLLLV